MSEHIRREAAESGAGRLLTYTCAAALIVAAALHVKPLVAGFMALLGR